MIARPEVTGRKITTGTPDEPTAAYSVSEFCAAHRISVPFFYKLRAAGLGPTEFKLGTRTLISKEAATAWRAAREKATAASI